MSAVIGICAAVEKARWGAWDETITMAPRAYAAAVQATGAIAFLLPPDASAIAEPDRILDRIDALMLAGGSDVDPASYGAAPDPQTKGVWPERDAFELALARRALERELPILGVCRGMQMLNIACGGTLVQHLPDQLGGDERHRHTPGTYGDHEVELEPGSLAAASAGSARLTVKSHHHQGVDRIGEGLLITGRSVPDGIVEALELPDRPYALGVLWHPEEDVKSSIIDSLVEAARTSVSAR